MNLPNDIKEEINRQYPSRLQNEKVKRLLKTLWTKDLNVGREQLARAILIIADRKLENIENFFQPDFQRDPRDILVEASSITPSCHYGINKFLELSNIKWDNESDYGLITTKDVYIYLPLMQSRKFGLTRNARIKRLSVVSS